MPKKDITAGETLCTFLKRNLLEPTIWPQMESAIDLCGRGKFWADFIEEVIATQLTGRLISAGTSIADELGGKPAIGSLDFDQRMSRAISDTTQASLDKKQRQMLFNFTTKAVIATYGSVTEADSKIIHKDAGKPPRCFLCNRELVMVRGPAAQDLPEDQRYLAVEDEHIWPRSYGGDTTADNLALACHRCNQHKKSFANWAMVDIQSLVRGLPEIAGPRPQDAPSALRTIAGWHRFAMASRLAHEVAQQKSLTLKEAYFAIRPRILAHPRVRRVSDVADFFNLACHSDN